MLLDTEGVKTITIDLIFVIPRIYILPRAKKTIITTIATIIIIIIIVYLSKTLKRKHLTQTQRGFNPLKGRAVNWLHFAILSARVPECQKLKM